jgi:hypothetical protein
MSYPYTIMPVSLIYNLLHSNLEDETSAHILGRCEALALLRQAYLGAFFLEPENIKNVSLGAIWNFGKATGLL